MSRPLKDLDRALGTVGLGQTCLALLAPRHGAVAEQPAVALVILSHQVRDEVVAAAVPLAALGADLHFHRVAPVCAVCRSGLVKPGCHAFIMGARAAVRQTPARPALAGVSARVKMGQLPHARITCRPPSSGVVRYWPRPRREEQWLLRVSALRGLWRPRTALRCARCWPARSISRP